MFERRKQGTINVITGHSSLSQANVDKFAATAEEVLARGVPRTVLDMQSVRLIDSAGLEMLLDTQDMYRDRGGALKLAAPNALCVEIFKVTDTAKEFELFESVNAAVSSFMR
jgi:anti-sigma B factor antagonist